MPTCFQPNGTFCSIVIQKHIPVNLSLIFEGRSGIKGTKKTVLFLRHTHKDHAWKLRVGTDSRFKSETDLTLAVLFTNHSIQNYLRVNLLQ